MADAKVSLCVLRLELCEDRDFSAFQFGDENSSEDDFRDSDLSDKRVVAPEDVQRQRGQRSKRQIEVEIYDLSGGEECHESGDEMLGEGDQGSTSRGTTGRKDFFSGNPSIEVTEGILHLFKEDKSSPGPGPGPSNASDSGASCSSSDGRSEMVCMLAVPAVLTSVELLNFLAPTSPDIQHVRIVRDRTPNQYMVLLKFRSQEGADNFYRTFNGMPFNSLEPDLCHLVYVSRVETVKESEGGSLPLCAHTELPTCPVCLERMDESVDGVLTILCNHSFHGECLSKWGDASCPVCRYTSTPELVEESHCFECASTSDLWICLICGNVGCGRYDNKHAEAHFDQTQHTYALQLGSNRVWDYAGDNFVHRLVQNKTDGKLVELEGGRRDPGGSRDWPKGPEEEEKVNSMQLEYTYLLTSQLETQRHYFENLLAKSEEQNRKEITEVKECAKKLSEENEILVSKLAAAKSERKNYDKKIQTLNGKIAKLTQELADEKQMNACLRANKSDLAAGIEELRRAAAGRDSEIADLKDQLRDIFFHLEAQRKVEQVDQETKGELQTGQLVVPGEGATGGGNGHGGRKSKRKSKN